MSTDRVISPLRYPGSKQKLVPYIEQILRYNCLSPETIVEPFFGGGSLTLSFLTRGLVSNAIISDHDPLIYSFWSVVFNEKDVLVDFVSKVRVNLKTFYNFKKISLYPNSCSKYDLAKACLFLNRTSFSGIIAPSSGPIGGAKQQSDYSIDCRFNRASIIEKLEYISAFRKQVKVLPYDWKKTIAFSLKKTNGKKDKKRFLYYLDPPFFHKAKDLYNTFFNTKQHRDLAEFLSDFTFYWILSYDNTPEILALYSTHKGRSLNIEMPYSINSHAKRIASELILTPLKLPHFFSLQKMS